MPSEAVIARMMDIVSEITDLGGVEERTAIVPNLSVTDAAPTGLTGFILVQDDRDGDNILAKTVPGVIYANNDKVNVLFVKGTEPIAFQQGSESSSSGIWGIVPSTSTDIFYNSGNVAIGQATAPATELEVNGDITISGGSQSYLFSDRSTNLVLQGQSSGVSTSLEFYSADGDGTDLTGFNIFGVGTPGAITNRERLQIRYNSTNIFEIFTEADGTGTLRPLIIYTEGNSNQIYLDVDGDVGIKTNAPTVPLHVNGAGLINGDLTLSSGSQDYLFSDRSTNLVLQGQSSGVSTSLEFYSADGDGTDITGFNVFGVGTPGAITNRERLQIRYNPTNIFEIFTEADGTGTLRPLIMYTEGNTNQLYLEIDGDVAIGSSTTSAKLHIDQSSVTGAKPVALFNQADVSEEMLEFASTIGVGNAIEAVGAKTLTVTHFIKVTLPGSLTRYFSVGTIA